MTIPITDKERVRMRASRHYRWRNTWSMQDVRYSCWCEYGECKEPATMQVGEASLHAPCDGVYCTKHGRMTGARPENAREIPA